MPKMSSADALALADYFTTFAGDLADYQADHGDDTDVDQIALSNTVSVLTLHAKSLVNDAVAVSFNDSGTAVQQLQTSMKGAADALSSLKDQTGQYERIASIAASMVNIAVALAQDKPAAAVQAAVSLGATLAKPIVTSPPGPENA